jgi:hypothetical protein
MPPAAATQLRSVYVLWLALALSPAAMDSAVYVLWLALALSPAAMDSAVYVLWLALALSPAAMDSAPPGRALTATISQPANLVPLSVICSRFFIFSICVRLGTREGVRMREGVWVANATAQNESVR